jgi:hypothetical protein
MKNLMFGLCLALGLAACGSDSKFTWGDASFQLSTDFCEALATCGYFGDGSGDSPQKLAECVSHTNFHLCELPGNCDEELPEGSQDVSDACTVAMEAFVANDAETDACYYLGYWGFVPEECVAVLEMDPAREDESDSSSHRDTGDFSSIREMNKMPVNMSELVR